MARPRARRAETSGRKALAAARAAGGDDLAASHGGHAGAKTMTALAHEFGRLISPLHGSAPVYLGASTEDWTRSEYKRIRASSFRFLAKGQKIGGDRKIGSGQKIAKARRDVGAKPKSRAAL
jgi:hypothetical protein